MDIFETISKRISIRSYHSEPASTDDLEAHYGCMTGDDTAYALVDVKNEA